MNTIIYLESFKNNIINENLNRLFASHNLDERMGCVDEILHELERLDVDVTPDMEDSIKDLTLQ